MIVANEKGQMTAEFMIAIVMAFGLFMLFFAMSFTFSVIEISQYVVYSTSRAHAASNLDMEAQKKAGDDKFKQLTNSSAIGNLYKNGWYVIGQPTFKQGGEETFRNELANQNEDPTAFFKNVFVGVSVPFEAKIMTMKIPFISTNDEDDVSVFKTNINAILLREVSQKECQVEHWGKDRRGRALQALGSGRNFYKVDKYFRMEDNGC